MNGTMSVLVVGDLAPECIARLEEGGLRVDARPGWGEAELAGGVDGYHALVAGPGAPVTAAVLARGQALSVVGSAGVDVDGIDVAEATRRGIVVVHAPDAGAHLRGRARARARAGVRPRPGRRGRRAAPRRRRPAGGRAASRSAARRSGSSACARARRCSSSGPARSA